MRLMIALAGCSALVGAVQAQVPTERDDVHVRNECRLAAQALTTGQPSPHYGWALGYISRCEESGPPAVAALWDGLSATDRRDLDAVAYNTGRLRDRRILDAVVRAAQDAGRPTRTRLAALQVLASFADRAHASIETLETPPEVAVMPGIIDFVSHEGAQPLPPGAPDAILAAVRALANADPDPTVRRAAPVVARALQVRLAADP